MIESVRCYTVRDFTTRLDHYRTVLERHINLVSLFIDGDAVVKCTILDLSGEGRSYSDANRDVVFTRGVLWDCFNHWFSGYVFRLDCFSD